MLKRLMELRPKWMLKEPKPKPLEDIIWARLKVPALGMFIFACVIIGVLCADYYNHLEDTRLHADLVNLFHEWQTLIGGGYAIIAAIFAGRVIVVQIARAEEIEQARLSAARIQDERNTARALMAARSVMPLTLNVLTDYANAVAKASITVLDRSAGRRVRLTVDRMPPLPLAPSETIPSLQAFILAAPVEMGPYVADLLSDLQLLSANASSAWSRTIASDEGHIVHRNNFEALIGRSAVLYARISGLYAFARRETDIVPDQPMKANLDTALRLWLVAPDAYPRYVEAAESYFRKATSREV